MENNIDDYLEDISEDRYERREVIKIDILNNEIILFEKCNCVYPDGEGDDDCYFCNGKGYFLTTEGEQLLNFIEAIPMIKEILK